MHSSRAKMVDVGRQEMFFLLHSIHHPQPIFKPTPCLLVRKKYKFLIPVTKVSNFRLHACYVQLGTGVAPGCFDGLTLPMRGLKYSFQGTISAKNLLENSFSPFDKGTSMPRWGRLDPLALPCQHLLPELEIHNVIGSSSVASRHQNCYMVQMLPNSANTEV